MGGIDDMVQGLMEYLRENEGLGAYLVLGASAAVEYVFPPLPGDTLILFGAFLAATAGYNGPIVYGMMTLGSILGGLVAYGGGRWLAGRPSRLGWLLRYSRARWALETLEERFARHGAVYLVVNRFLPALRAFFFVGAGLARMPVWKIVVFGGISAAAWNALLLGAGYTVGQNWGRLVQLFERYTVLVLVLLAVGVVILVIRHRVIRRKLR